jgi:hypothetical protein
MLKVILGILLFVALSYCAAGVVMALYESSQTDDPFDWKTVITWLPKMLS